MYFNPINILAWFDKELMVSALIIYRCHTKLVWIGNPLLYIYFLKYYICILQTQAVVVMNLNFFKYS